MSALTRTQRKYDHRLRELVQSTGSVDVAVRRGVPRSTAYGWRNKPSTEVMTLDVLNKMLKQRRDSIDQYVKGNRQDLADVEQAEIEVIQGYLPEQMSEADLDKLIDETIAATGAESIRDMGKVMGAIKAKAQGRADMGAVGARVKARLGA